MWIVKRSFGPSVVNHSARVPMFAFGVSRTKELGLTSTPGVMVLLVAPPLMVATPLVLNLRRPTARKATPPPALTAFTPVPPGLLTVPWTPK